MRIENNGDGNQQRVDGDDEKENSITIGAKSSPISRVSHSGRENLRLDHDELVHHSNLINDSKECTSLDLIPIEVFQHSFLPFVSVRDLLSLLSLNKYYQNIVDANECWREKFYLLLPKCQSAYLEKLKLFEVVWKSCLFGKIKLTKTALQKVAFKDISYKKLLRNVFVDGKLYGLMLFNTGTHKRVSKPYSYLLHNDIECFSSVKSVEAEDNLFSLNGQDFSILKTNINHAIETRFPGVEFFTGKCSGLDQINDPDISRYYYFGISVGMYINLVQIWYPSCDLITNVLGRKLPYKSFKKRQDFQGKEGKWALSKNYSKNMRGKLGCNLDITVHGVWSDLTGRAGYFTSENANNNKIDKTDSELLQKKLQRLNYEQYDKTFEELSAKTLQEYLWNCVILDTGEEFTIQFFHDHNSNHIDGFVTNYNKEQRPLESLRPSCVDGNILDCYFSFNIIDWINDIAIHKYLVLCEWENNTMPKNALVISTKGIVGKAKFICTFNKPTNDVDRV
ncbi:hypothetical protein C9374_010368 [Naegleria lovaniensis]|uniref:F-box domain-containing protein n=1 Tax=Naegleria lovaniensis TaxID=51637 RepID=A0AA88GGQ8_NAELO|nr:uncharacterized protein C9374_010368 [Naegleria lovaniensis]KAG2374994.1 hypothetical protein C9374_010368 [Naegleria lovaniensis]